MHAVYLRIQEISADCQHILFGQLVALGEFFHCKWLTKKKFPPQNSKKRLGMSNLFFFCSAFSTRLASDCIQLTSSFCLCTLMVFFLSKSQISSWNNFDLKHNFFKDLSFCFPTSSAHQLGATQTWLRGGWARMCNTVLYKKAQMNCSCQKSVRKKFRITKIQFTNHGFVGTTFCFLCKLILYFLETEIRGKWLQVFKNT